MMATDNLSYLLTVMTLTGLWPKSEWSTRAKFLYLLYMRTIDCLSVLYLVTKVIIAYQSLDCNKIFEEIFEASYVFVLFLQRIGLSEIQFSQIVKKLRQMQTTADIKGRIARQYNSWEKNFCLLFAMATVFGLFQLFFLQKPPAYCAAQDKDRFDPSKRLIIEVWLPYDETRSPYWEVSDLFLKVLVVMTAAQLYIFSVLVPLFVLETCCHFKIVASLLRNNLVYQKERSVPDKVHLRNVIRYHQQVMDFARHLSGCFRRIMAVKLVFSVIPMVVAVFSFSKQIGDRKLAMGHFMVQLFVELFTYCWFGEQLTIHSHMVSEATYETQWLDMDRQDKKSVVLVMRMAQRPIKLDYISGGKSANLDTFLAVSVTL